MNAKLVVDADGERIGLHSFPFQALADFMKTTLLRTLINRQL